MNDTPTLNTQDASLAEGRWLWRRLFVFLTSLALWALVHRAVERAPVEALPDIVERLLMLIALITLLYLVAPTAQQLVALSVRFRIGAGGRP
ncbi:hypothetical protein [Brevundimonas halotolerans]|uniref:Uncharacterized protein n=1 Tax=Brevundimonas halotolerans TaxID=69670 RepID=A0A7W9A1V6_9CAUL|nr:hypothetical protein [Brevundimonas halotolerans]MBB5659877.1 hypothetical protein [Brevundimonas halotolerans]